MKNHKPTKGSCTRLLSLKQKLLLLALALLPLQLVAQQGRSFTISGTVYEQVDRAKKQPMPFATVAIKDYSKASSTDKDGRFLITNVPRGKVSLSVSFFGKVDIDTVINVNSDMVLDFLMLDENFKLDEVVVTATTSRAEQATSSKISRNAIDHLQATSLSDILSLLPGGLTSNQDLSNSSQASLRSALSSDMNALGTAIIRDGAPISNNTNLQALSPAVAGSTLGMVTGEAKPFGGVDLRSISTDNIESVEVIRGIPSVQYGDLTSGAIIINSKAGREPLKVNVKSNPNVFQTSANTGVQLPGRNGAVNFSMDYAHNYKNIYAAYETYQRLDARIVYSNKFFKNLLSTNTTLSAYYGVDKQKKNPDDTRLQKASNGNTLNWILNTNGTFHINKGILSNISYVASAGFTTRDSYKSELVTNRIAPYSLTTIDGTVLSNTPGLDIYDSNGNKITHFGAEDMHTYARMLPSEYLSRFDIKGKEINLYGKLSTTLFKQLGRTNHKILIGAEVRREGNKGDGKKFTSELPPAYNLSALNAGFRERSFRDIPYMDQLGVFVQENFSWTFAKRKLSIVGGLRLDKVTNMEAVVAPRINGSFELIPDALTIRGGYGVTTKAPTLMFLFPEKAYFEYVNINEADIKGYEDLLITTTKVYDTKNEHLELAKNVKKELGFDLKLGKISLYATAFSEETNNGYRTNNTISSYKNFEYIEYQRVGGNVMVKDRNNVLSSYNMPTNTSSYNSKGVEFDVDFGRFDAIRTSFVLNGAYIRSQSYDNGYTFYDASSVSASGRTHVALYEEGMKKSSKEIFSNSLRIIHNIPEIGFVVSLTTQVIWLESDWNKFGNDSIPILYISKNDGKVYDFPFKSKAEIAALSKTDPMRLEFEPLIRKTLDEKAYIKESYDPSVSFNINLTKEIGNFMRASFFANNMFRSRPITESKRNPGEYLVRNSGAFSFFFGLELSLIF